MNVSTKFVRASLAMSVCIAVLAACQDRGQFKSKSWTPEQIQANIAAKQAREANAKNVANNANGGAVGEVNNNGTGTPAQNPGLPSTNSNPAANAPAGQQSSDAGTPGSAQSQIIQEAMLARDKFVEENNALMKQLDSMAVKTFKGVTSVVTGKVGSLAIAIDAAVQIGNDIRFLTVAPASLIADAKDAKAAKLEAVLKESDQVDAAVLPADQVSVYAVCKDAVCSEVHVRIQVAIEGGVATLAFVQRPVGQEYQITDSNLKDKLISFEDFQKSARKETPAQTKPAANPADVPANVVGGETPAAAPAATPKSDKAETADGENAGGETTVMKPNAPATAAPAQQSAAAQPASKSVMFKPTAGDENQLPLPKVDAPAVMTLKSKPATIPQDPGAFTLKQETKAPGIFGATTGLANSAVTGAQVSTGTTSAQVSTGTTSSAEFTGGQDFAKATADRKASADQKDVDAFAEILNEM